MKSPKNMVRHVKNLQTLAQTIKTPLYFLH